MREGLGALNTEILRSREEQDIVVEYVRLKRKLLRLAEKLTPEAVRISDIEATAKFQIEKRISKERRQDEKESLGVRKGGARARKLGWYKS